MKLRDLVAGIEAGRSLACEARRARDDEWAVIKVSAMTSGTFRPDEAKPLPQGVTPDPRHEIRAGDLLISRANTTAYVGASVLVPAIRPRLLLSDKSLRLLPRPEVDPRWLHLMLNAPPVRRAISVRASGTKDSMRNITQRDLLDLDMPDVPLAEQHRIVAVLEDHLSRLDAGRAYVAAANRRVAHWVRDTLDRALADAAQAQLPLAELVERVEAGRSLGGAAPPAEADEWGVIRVSAMTWGEFRADQNKAVPGTDVDPRFEIHAGDVLVSRANTTEYVGAPVLVGAVRPRLLLSDKSLRLVLKPDVDSRWLVEVLRSTRARRQISARATGTKDSMRNISQAGLLSITVPVADAAAQQAIVILAAQVRDDAGRLAAASTALNARATALRRAVLAAAFASGV